MKFNKLFLVSLFVLLNACSTIKTTEPATEASIETKAYTDEQKAEFELAISALRNGADADAEDILLSLTKSAPALGGPYTNLGILYIKRERFNEAVSTLQQATEVNPENAVSWNALGVAYRELGEFAKAETSYLLAVEKNPNYAKPHKNLGILYDIYLNKLAKAKSHYETYQSLLKEPDDTVNIWLSDVSRRLDSEGN